MKCGGCKHFRPARNPDTGRPLPSQAGSCTYPVEWPTLPKAFLKYELSGYGDIVRMQYPRRNLVWRENKEPCECFEATPAKKNAEAKIPLIDTTEKNHENHA